MRLALRCVARSALRVISIIKIPSVAGADSPAKRETRNGKLVSAVEMFKKKAQYSAGQLGVILNGT